MISEEEKCRILQIRAYADEYVNELENEVHSEFMQSIIRDAIEDAVRWADSHPKNKIEKGDCIIMNTTNHEYYVSLEVAKLLKEVGFDWKCNGVFLSEDGTQYAFIKADAACDNNNSKYNLYNISAPTLEIAQRWLREVKHLDISIYYDPTIKSQPYAYSIYDVEEKFNDIFGKISPVTHSYSDGYFYTYEEAQESAIKKALEIILEK